MTRATRWAIGLACAAASLPAVGAAQGTIDRPPVLSGDWVGVPGIVYFHFVHRFSVSGAPERKVINTPTFVIAAALPADILAGLSYATNSNLVPRYPNEHELFVRAAPWQQAHGSLVDLGFQVDYNDAAQGVDGEATLARRFGALRLIGSGRLLRDLRDSSGFQPAFAGGAVLRLTRYVALAGDVGGAPQRLPGEKLAWSGGLQLAIPLTPHTFSLQATNVSSNTLQGSSRGTDKVRYGFEFTVPITLRRYFGKREETPTDSAKGPVAATVHIQGMAFRPGTIEIQRGATIEWRNDDPLPHTVTAADGSFTSPLIEPGQTWRHTFDKPGEYAVHCTPHPFMRSVIVVR